MNKFLQKYQFDGLLMLGLTLLYFATRLFNLTVVPMFTDEAIYMRWSQVGLQDAAWRFIPLTDGKQPLYHWFVMGVMSLKVFSDPLIEGRIVSVMAGFITAIAIGILTYVLFKRRLTAYLATMLYIVSPFMLVYDRLAIVDSLLTTISVVSLLFAVLVVKYVRLDLALLLGLSIGAGMLTKSSGLLFLLLSPVTLLLSSWPKKKRLKQLGLLIFFFLVVVILSQSLYSILRLSQFFYRISQKNYEFIIPLSDFIRSPFSMTWGNLQSLIKWQVGYLTIPWLVLVFISWFHKEYWREHLMLVIYVVFPMILMASFNKIIFPRFLVFSTPFLIIMVASGLTYVTSKIKLEKFKFLAVLLAILLPAFISLTWLISPGQAAIPQADKNQYYLGQPSGHGVKEIVQYLEEQALEEPIFLGTDGTFGLTPDAFLVYLRDNENVHIEGYYPVKEIPQEVREKAQDVPTYFVYYNVQEIPEQQNLELISEFEKTSSDQVTYLRLFKVNKVELNEVE